MGDLRFKKRFALVGAVAILAAACGGTSSDTPAAPAPAPAPAPADDYVAPQGVTDEEIVIAAFGPMTGPVSWIGLGTRDGFQMAVDEINDAGGVNGRRIRLEYYDDQQDVAFAQTVLRRITGEAKPFMVYSGSGSTIFVSVVDQLRELGIPVYNGFSGSPAGRRDQEVDLMFHGQAVAGTAVTSDIVTLVEDLGSPDLAIMHDVGEWGRSVCEPAIGKLEAAGITPSIVQTYAAGDTDYTGQLVAIRNTGAKVVLNCGHFPEAAVILQQAAEVGLDAVFIGDTAQANATVWGRAGAAAEDFLFNWYSPVFLTDETGPMAEFRERYVARYPNAPEGRPAHSDTFAYGDAYIIAEALERAGRELTIEGFRDAMLSLDGFQPTPINAADRILQQREARRIHDDALVEGQERAGRRIDGWCEPD
jgi:branched-chain amino acid transport system substrate-binding protein